MTEIIKKAYSKLFEAVLEGKKNFDLRLPILKLERGIFLF